MHDIIRAASRRRRRHPAKPPGVPRVVDLPAEDRVWAQVGRGVVVAQIDETREARLEACSGFQIASLRLQAACLILDVQSHPHAQPRQVRDQVKDVPLDPAEAMERKDDAGEHRNA